jgi:hypothetical protein
MSDDFFGLFEEKRHISKDRIGSRWEHDGHDNRDGDAARRYENDNRDDHHRNHDYGHLDTSLLRSYANRILRNRLLLAGILIFALLCLIGVIVLVILFFPFLMRLVNFVFNNDLKGVLEVIQPILGLFMEGSGK